MRSVAFYEACKPFRWVSASCGDQIGAASFTIGRTFNGLVRRQDCLFVLALVRSSDYFKGVVPLFQSGVDGFGMRIER